MAFNVDDYFQSFSIKQVGSYTKIQALSHVSKSSVNLLKLILLYTMSCM